MEIVSGVKAALKLAFVVGLIAIAWLGLLYCFIGG